MSIGRVEQFNANSIVGWAYDPERLDEPLIVTISVNGSVTQRLRADIYRTDLAKNIGTGAHGFEGSLDLPLENGANKVIVGLENSDYILSEGERSVLKHDFPEIRSRLRESSEIYKFPCEFSKIQEKIPIHSEVGQRLLREVVKNTKIVLVFFTNRSGSNLVTDMLDSMQCGGGFTNEPFLVDTILQESRKHGFQGIDHYLAEVIRVWSKGGAAFLKISWGALFWLSAEGLFDQIIPSCKCIWTRRHDKLEQAISYVAALRSGTFFELVGGSSPSKATYALEGIDEGFLWDIARHHHNLIVGDTRLEYFSSLYQLTPLVIYYEDILADIQGTYAKIYEFLSASFDLKGSPQSYTPRLMKQSSREQSLMIKQIFLKAIQGQAFVDFPKPNGPHVNHRTPALLPS